MAALVATVAGDVPRRAHLIRWWVKVLTGSPSPPEFLSGAFDFNRAPFFRSFVEVRVEPSASRVRVLPHAAHGRLAWGMQRIGAVVPAGAQHAEPVEFVFPLSH